MSTGEEVSIFLVEDDDIDAMSIDREFKRKKIANRLVRARDGLEALEMLRSGKVPQPYIILLDLNMPRMGGLDFLREIRSDRSLRTSVVFVLTSSRSEEDLCLAYDEQIAGYCLKDGSGDGLLRVVDMLEGYWRIVLLPGPNAA